MPIKSATSHLINRIIATGPAPLLKEAGYRKVARSFFADTGGLFKIVQFQASMWNTPDSAEFTINLIIVWPYFHKIWTGSPFPKNPASAAPFLSQRIGSLMPANRDYWWKITPKSNIDRIASQVTKAVAELGLPFLDRHADFKMLASVARRTNAYPPMIVNPQLCPAILLSSQGKRAEAARVVQSLAKTNKLESFAETIQLIARRLKLKVVV